MLYIFTQINSHNIINQRHFTRTVVHDRDYLYQHRQLQLPGQYLQSVEGQQRVSGNDHLLHLGGLGPVRDPNITVVFPNLGVHRGLSADRGDDPVPSLRRRLGPELRVPDPGEPDHRLLLDGGRLHPQSEDLLLHLDAFDFDHVHFSALDVLPQYQHLVVEGEPAVHPGTRDLPAGHFGISEFDGRDALRFRGHHAVHAATRDLPQPHELPLVFHRDSDLHFGLHILCEFPALLRVLHPNQGNRLFELRQQFFDPPADENRVPDSGVHLEPDQLVPAVPVFLVHPRHQAAPFEEVAVVRFGVQAVHSDRDHACLHSCGVRDSFVYRIHLVRGVFLLLFAGNHRAHSDVLEFFHEKKQSESFGYHSEGASAEYKFHNLRVRNSVFFQEFN